MELRNAIGKKVFFLYPHSVIRSEMFDILIMAGFEAYSVMDHQKAKLLLERFPDSIMFINIDYYLSEDEWEKYILDIQSDPKTQESRLGIMSYNADLVLMQKYLMEMSIPCGYVQLKLGVHESARIILAALDANEARGRRRAIRANCNGDKNVTLNYQGLRRMHYGSILDISISGLAVRFTSFEVMEPNARLNNMQLNLKGHIVMVNGTLMGTRQNDPNTYIILLDEKMPDNYKLAIHRFIKTSIQRHIDNIIKN